MQICTRNYLKNFRNAPEQGYFRNGQSVWQTDMRHAVPNGQESFAIAD